MNNKQSAALFDKAQHTIPGGVNSPVRAFKSVGGTPLFIKSAQGAYITDEDDNSYIELINSWGPMILGHAHPVITSAVQDAVNNSLSFGAPTSKEIDIAELICDMVPSIEKVRMVNSGTEATMSAVRVARGYTGRNKMIKIEGCYHGHGDSFLIAAGSGAVTMGVPNSPGVTEGTAKDTLLAPYNDIEKIKELVAENKDEIAALIIEPVPGNMGLVLPKDNYLQKLRDICTEEGIVLIFDEVMTGFRLAKGGAQEVFGVTPDMTTLGKIIGGGMPVGAYGGKKEIMDFVAPAGPVYQAGTLSGNPVAMAAGLNMLKYLNDNPSVYTDLAAKGEKLAKGVQSVLDKHGLPYKVTLLGSMICIFFTDQEVVNFADAQTTDTAKFGKFFHQMLANGVYLPPSQYESWFMSNALTDENLDQIIDAVDKSLEAIK
ncbi:glutamate-1-semialdehyde 2,1-aminomutase [Flammeovirga yaeyamensis]|uniref:Glutamate-1-semialdehyde 2,1-aminomutase n=1 Tax=Flammeovirga yaeyamensis TaxID=367791 RepID=A0AAX1N858_9BACT|nr:glutamate-1-semialdehyde 2,1-aminomutase [Flammeovirga yaeyamensis]MBB3698858.1 glutamate-1-semialdehyde 2,1-aminomutase [Flammeovirga yaeyamensis]NMF37443.1 glutamate-1-semialdehyde 2,1-aminomutase [Flammeovirga yaeyamensis]QWG03744.1 glutamate-1-semialdehyde 2,1-aminomutase [Flammeovirga yaeyamensis]